MSDFYIGYQKQAPEGLRPFLVKISASLIVAAVAMALVFLAIQHPFDPGVFEFGNVRSFSGVVISDPYPLLKVDRPHGADGEAPSSSHYPLVAFGKGEGVA